MKLSPDDAALFYRLMWDWQFYVNDQLGILPQIKTREAYARLPQDDKYRVRSVIYEHMELLDRFLAENPAGLAPEELAGLAGWKRFVKDDFFVERFLKKGAVFLDSKNPPKAYLVLGLVDEIQDVLPLSGPPYYVQAVLLPFKGRIIYDGLLTTRSIVFGPGIRSSLRDSYMWAKQNGQIFESLDAEVAPRLPASRKPAAADLQPAIDRVVAETEKLKAPNQSITGGALALVKASAHLAQAAIRDPHDLATLRDLQQKVNRALKRLDTALDRADYDL